MLFLLLAERIYTKRLDIVLGIRVISCGIGFAGILHIIIEDA
jgi:hypothetical protein